jgi:hypothetical protein
MCLKRDRTRCKQQDPDIVLMTSFSYIHAAQTHSLQILGIHHFSFQCFFCFFYLFVCETCSWFKSLLRSLHDILK